jgi:hypothetical protein
LSWNPQLATVTPDQLNLGSLFFNGDRLTHALLSGSFAINAGDQLSALPPVLPQISVVSRVMTVIVT